MTFRARPAGSRSRTWDDRDRRNMLLNIGFGIIVLIAVLLLAVAAGAAWYSDNLAEAGAVNGQVITKDEHRKRVEIDTFRNDYEERRLRTLLTAGQITVADYQARQSIVTQRKQRVEALALERLIDAKIQGELAEQEGVTVTEADIDARFAQEATIPELRHIWLIEVAPETAEGERAPGDAEIAAAREKAEDALADLEAGREWETVAREVSTDDSRDKGGDIGFVDDQTRLDPAMTEALFAADLDLDTPTEVVEGADGIFRIGRVTEIIEPRVDDALEAEIEAEDISIRDFRTALRADVTREKLDEAVTAEFLVAGPQRRVAQIKLGQGVEEGEEGAVRTRHILYSPKDDPAGAGTLDEDDPAWEEAEEEARATYEKLSADISLFDATARAESDEAAAATTGGKLPYFAPGTGIDEDFAAAIFAEGLRDGQLLEPVRTQFGWHVIQIQHGPTDLDWMRKLRVRIVDEGADFGELARDTSETEDAADGGDIGWIAKGILQPVVEQQIFATEVGGVSQPLVVPDDGVYLFQVSEEEVRELDAEQRAELEQNVFPTWYAEKKLGYEIRRDPAITGGF